MDEKKLVGIREMRKYVSDRTGLKRDDAELVIRTVFDVIKQYMYDEYEVRIPNFSIFYLNKLRSRTIRIPGSTQKVFKEPHFTPRARFSVNFKRQVQRKKCTLA